ncbi:MAG: YhfC family intramembrane metalloprotease, partial [Oscillospiraceae bacterium]|nr:YhfC family intramembrane metalloprotease [Oscillospiraceae bacterium]
MVPAISFVCMAVSVALSVGAPVALFFVVRKKYGKGFLPVLVGGAGFILFATVLEQVLHAAVLRPGA